MKQCVTSLSPWLSCEDASSSTVVAVVVVVVVMVPSLSPRVAFVSVTSAVQLSIVTSLCVGSIVAVVAATSVSFLQACNVARNRARQF